MRESHQWKGDIDFKPSITITRNGLEDEIYELERQNRKYIPKKLMNRILTEIDSGDPQRILQAKEVLEIAIEKNKNKNK